MSLVSPWINPRFIDDTHDSQPADHPGIGPNERPSLEIPLLEPLSSIDMFTSHRPTTESRSRRPLNPSDSSQPLPPRTRRVPSSSRIDISLPQPTTLTSHPSQPQSPSQTYTPTPSSESPTSPQHSILHSFCQSLSYFTLFYILHLTPTSHSFFITFSACLTSIFAFALVAKHTLPALHLYINRPSSRAAIVFVALLHMYAILGTAQATLFLGPLRALIPFAAYPTLSRVFFTFLPMITPSLRRQSPVPASRFRLIFAPLFLTTVALVLLTHDATGGRIPQSSADHVHQRVLLPVVRIFMDRVPPHLQNQTFPSSRAFRRRFRRKSYHHTSRSLQHSSSTIKQQLDSQRSKDDSQSPPQYRSKLRRRLLSITANQPPSTSNSTNTLINVTASNASQAGSEQALQQGENSTRLKDLNKTEIRPINSLLNQSLNVNNNSTNIDDDIDQFPDPLPLTYSSAIFAIFLAVTSPLANRLAIDFVYKLGSDDGNPIPFLLLSYSACAILSIICFIGYGLFFNSTTKFFPDVTFDLWWKGALAGILFFVVPTLVRFQSSTNCRRNLRSQRQALPSFPPSNIYVFKLTTALPSVTLLYPALLITLLGTRLFGFSSFTRGEELSFFSISTALLFLVVAREEAAIKIGRTAYQPFLLPGGYPIALPLVLTRRWTLVMRKIGRKIREIWLMINQVLSEIEDNRASWQVLNFLMLQSGMALVELLYAGATHSSGLFSFSTDNIFCSIALASGLYATRMTAKKPSTMFSYGYFRAESICGFANGVMLVYVAALIVVESFERSSSQGSGGIARAFSVCFLGIVGNVLGLYFFPPETRRENHNVQGIYLHILTNTLAFTSMAVSTATRAIAPDWHVLDIGVAVIVGCGIISFALPLIARSGQLLMLMVSNEKRGKLSQVEEQLKGISGVRRLNGLRVWNLTPNSLWASVKLEVENESNSLHQDVLSGARSIFSLIGITASQCTIQITYTEPTFDSQSDVSAINNHS